MNHYEELEFITDVLLKEKIDYLELKMALERYKELMLQLSAIDLDREENRRNIDLANGTALGTTWAATCIDDLIRTKRFVKGLFQAVQSLKQVLDSPVQILYAGCGPFATLVLPLTTKFTSQEVQFTLLEINEHSHQLVTQVVSELELNHYIRSIELEDASNYKIRPDQKVDILLTETMQAGLLNEMQVPIILNLTRQLDPDVQLIPERVSVDLGLTKFISPDSEVIEMGEHQSRVLAPILELSQRTIADLQFQKTEVLKKTRKVELNSAVMKNYTGLAILTEIAVFGDQKIHYDESGLTVPSFLEDLRTLQDPPYEVVVFYKLRPVPQIDYELTRVQRP